MKYPGFLKYAKYFGTSSPFQGAQVHFEVISFCEITEVYPTFLFLHKYFLSEIKLYDIVKDWSVQLAQKS